MTISLLRLLCCVAIKVGFIEPAWNTSNVGNSQVFCEQFGHVLGEVQGKQNRQPGGKSNNRLPGLVPAAFCHI